MRLSAGAHRLRFAGLKFGSPVSTVASRGSPARIESFQRQLVVSRFQRLRPGVRTADVLNSNENLFR
jgi:hypothetical protein